MSKKLVYFNSKGMGQSLRYMLHYGGIQFEDERMSHSEWDAKKNVSSSFGRLPIYIDGERTLNQSMAIARFIGRGLNFVPTDPWEEACVDAFILTIHDLLNSFMALIREQDPTKRESVKKEIIEETVPFYFSRFKKILKENNGHIGKQLTWADFVFVGLVELVEPILQFDIQGKYPVVKEIVKKIHGLPGVKEYLAQSASS